MSPDMPAKVTNLRSIRTVTLIEAVVCEGEGTYEDPVRLVRYYSTLDGEPVATSDDGICEPAGVGAPSGAWAWHEGAAR